MTRTTQLLNSLTLPPLCCLPELKIPLHSSTQVGCVRLSFLQVSHSVVFSCSGEPLAAWGGLRRAACGEGRQRCVVVSLVTWAQGESLGAQGSWVGWGWPLYLGSGMDAGLTTPRKISQSSSLSDINTISVERQELYSVRNYEDCWAPQSNQRKKTPCQSGHRPSFKHLKHLLPSMCTSHWLHPRTRAPRTSLDPGV